MEINIEMNFLYMSEDSGGGGISLEEEQQQQRFIKALPHFWRLFTVVFFFLSLPFSGE